MIKIVISEYDLLKEETESVIVCNRLKNGHEETVVVSQRRPSAVLWDLKRAKSEIETAIKKVQDLKYFKTKEDCMNLEIQEYINGEEMIY